MRISEAAIYVADCETTGLDYAAGDRIVEFAAKRFPHGDEMAILANPGRPIPIVASAVHGLIDTDVLSAPSLDEAYGEIDAFLPEDAVVVFHNAVFDTTMLPCLRDRRVICTKRLAQHLVTDAPGYSNQVLRYHLGGAKLDLRGIPPHRALADVLVTSFILGKLIDAYLGGGRPDDIDALVRFAAAPIMYSHFPFGKHRNAPIADVPVSYIEWMLCNVSDLDKDLRASLLADLKRRAMSVPA